MSMADTEKIVCCDTPNSSAEMMALMNNNNNWMNNPFMYLIWLAFFGNNGFGFGNKTSETNDLVAALQDTVNTNHNNDLAMQAILGNGQALTELAGNLNVGVATLGNAISSIKGAIDLVGSTNALSAEKVVNSVILGNKDLVQLIATCCCENKQLVTTMGYEGQLRDLANTAALTSRIDQLSNGILTGFALIGYLTAELTNTLSNSLQNQTLTIIDKISSMEVNAMLDKINSLTASLTAANSRAERASELAPIITQLNAIKAAQPATTTVNYPLLTAIPNYVVLGYQNYNGGFWG